jgi:DNA-binding MarR family transcriptional regulator
MIEEAAGITRLIDKLEGAGLVVRDRGASADRRQVFCRITPAGLALLAAIDPQVASSTDEVLTQLDDSRLDALLELLDEVRAGAHLVGDAEEPVRAPHGRQRTGPSR